MLVLKSEPVEEDFTSFIPAQAELDYWEHLKFSFDMDNEQRNQSRGEGTSRHPQRSRSVSQPTPEASGSHNTSNDHALLAQFVASFGLPTQSDSPESFESLAHALRALQGTYPYIPPPVGPATNYQIPEHLSHPQFSSAPQHNFPWPTQQSLQVPYGVQPIYNPGQIPYPYNAAAYGAPEQVAAGSSRNTSRRTQSVPSPPSVTPPESIDQTEGEALNATEDKRRRNTAASARFRVKKKRRTLNLERTVSDLTGRAEELEREAAELRRENGWLKEIVMLKGRTVTVASSAPGKSQETADKDKEGKDSGHSDNEEGLWLSFSHGHSHGHVVWKAPFNKCWLSAFTTKSWLISTGS